MALQRTPVILLHGWGGTYASTFRAAGWDDVLRAHGLEPVGVDLPGHVSFGAPYDPAAYGDLAGEVAMGLPLGARCCIAFSLGAKIALEIAVRSPGRFDRLVLGGVGDNLFAPEPVGSVLVETLLGERDPSDGPDIVRSLLTYVKKGGADPRSLAAVVRRPHNPIHTEDRLATITAPVLLVNGTEDTAALPDDRLRTALPNVQHLLLDCCDHVGLTDDARFIGAAARFLKG